MARRLPDDPHKRRLAIFRSLYQHMPHWRELIVAGQVSDIIIIPDTGEEVYYGDLLVGLDRLPPRQRQAFELICLQGYTETAAAKIMLPDSKWSTTVQQHVNAALERMVAAYDEQQSGVRQFIKKWRSLMALHPVIKTHLTDALKAARADIVNQMGELKAALSQVDQMLKDGDDKRKSEPATKVEATPAAADDEAAAQES